MGTNQVTLALLSDESYDDLPVLSRRLQRELAVLPIDTISREYAAAPPGAKSGEMLVAGTLFLGLAPHVIPGLVSLLKDWLFRQEGRRLSIKLTIGDTSVEVAGATPNDTDRAMEMVRKLSAAMKTPE
jgi:hypothetical protein